MIRNTKCKNEVNKWSFLHETSCLLLSLILKEIIFVYNKLLNLAFENRKIVDFLFKKPGDFSLNRETLRKKLKYMFFL